MHIITGAGGAAARLEDELVKAQAARISAEAALSQGLAAAEDEAQVKFHLIHGCSAGAVFPFRLLIPNMQRLPADCMWLLHQISSAKDSQSGGPQKLRRRLAIAPNRV